MNRLRTALILTAAWLIVCCCSVQAQELRNSQAMLPDEPGEENILNRELWRFAKGTPYEMAERHINAARQAQPKAPAAEVVLPTGWKIAPAGRQVGVGRLPEEAIFYAGHIVVLNTGYYNKEPQEISIVDPASGQVVKVLYPGSLFPSAVAGIDDDLYISGGYDHTIYRYNNKFNLVKKYSVQGYAAGLAPLDRDHLAVVYMVVNVAPKSAKQVQYGQGKLAILNIKTGKIESEVDAGYFPHTVRYLNGKLYVSILGEDKLNVYDTHANLLKSLQVGTTPQDLCPDPQAHRLYVVNTGSDNLSVLDTKKDEVVGRIAIGSPGYGFGCGPTSCAVDGDRLFITLAYKNAVGVFNKRDGKCLGCIPTGWFPAKVILGNKWVAVLSAKGIKSRRPNVNGPQPVWKMSNEDQYVLTLLKGALGIIPRAQIETNLPAWTRQVKEGSPLYGFHQGLKLPIRYVFFIVRENRTYDQVLGDLGRGNGDPYLTLFGQKITPNAHKLAKQFVTLDNYYADGEISVLGHSYTTSGYASPFLEWLGNVAYSGRFASYPFGSVPATCSPKYLWDALDAKGVDYRIYGENYFLYTRAFRIIQENFGPNSDQAKQFYAQMMKLAADQDRGNELYRHAYLFQPQPASVAAAERLLLESPPAARELSEFLLGNDSLVAPLRTNAQLRRQFGAYLYHYPIAYRSWDLRYSDLDRARVWRADFENQLKHGSVLQFQYIWLPNDHTAGTAKGALSPYQFVAQNDAALGLIIDTIAQHKAIWKQSLILVTEDDAQNGPDHVDATRTVALAAGPWVKRGAVVRDRYDQLSMLRTIEVLLGLSPINQNDAMAVPMFGIFAQHPDYTPYAMPPPSKYLTAADALRFKRFLAGGKKQPDSGRP